MFDGVPPDQFHQFIAPRTSLPLHLSFPLHPSATSNTNHTFPLFDPYSPSHHPFPLQPPNLLHPLHHHHKHEEKEEISSRVAMNLEIQTERQLPELIDSTWTNDEVLALLRIRSSMESWFPDLSWEHVSRKLEEFGFKRTAEKCKEKFEEESRYFNNINYSDNYRVLSELEELYQGDQNPHGVGIEKTQQLEKLSRGRDKTDSRQDTSVTKQCVESEQVAEKSKERKRKRHDKFEMFKGFCKNIVNKMMVQQEEMHNKLLEDMLKRDEEKFAREEAWKKQEMDRMNKELIMMAQEQAVAGDKQAAVIEFLKKFAATSPANRSFGGVNKEDNLKVTNGSNPNTRSQSPKLSCDINGYHNILKPPPSSTMILNHQETVTSPANNNPSLPIACPSTVLAAENPSSSLAQDTLEVSSSSTSAPVPAPQNPSSFNSQNNTIVSYSVSTYQASSNPMSTEKGDVGRRWPRDEVLALINLRCSLNNNSTEDKDGNKAPLWERISQGMSELGYKRSAKRCKEKWENINKYFRKTKDVNKKRSLDSRTCPYFHQLSTLYSQGKHVPQSERPENQMNPLANHSQIPPETEADSSQVGSSMHVDEGEKTMMQVPALDLDHQS